MSDLTALMLVQARARGCARKSFLRSQLVDVQTWPPSRSRAPNAFVLEMLERARAMAHVGCCIGAGKGGPLEGIPPAIKDMFCPREPTTACSHILDNFVPTYDSMVTANLWRDGAVLLGKTNSDYSPWARRTRLVFRRGGFAAAPARGRMRSSGRAARRAVRRPRWRPVRFGATGTDTGGSISQPAAFTGTVGLKPIWPLLALGDRCLRALLTRPDPLPARCATARSCCARWPEPTQGCHQRRSAVPDYERRSALDQGMRIGIPKEYRMPGMSAEIEKLWQQGGQWLRGAGAELVEVSLPHTKYALPAYYIVAPAEASSNLARYDGVRYGLRRPAATSSTCTRTRRAGFGKELRRRIMIGTYVLSAGYYDAYYLRAQKVRTLIKRDFEKCFAQGVHAILTPATPSAAFGIGEKGRADPIEMYLNDVFTVTVNMAGLPGIAVPGGLDAQGLPLGLQLVGRPFEEGRCSRAAR